MTSPEDEDPRVLRAQEIEMNRRGFLSVPECARRLLRSPNVIYRAIKTGKLEAIEIAGQKYVEFESFAEFAGPLAGERPKWDAE